MWRTEAGTLMSLVVPIVVQMGSQQVMTMTDLIFLGHLGRFELAVGTLGSTLFNLLWFGIAGFGTGFDTLGSQSHGARDHVATRNWAMLAAASLSLCCVPASAILLCGRFLASRVLSQDPETSAAVGRFCAVLILGLWPVTLTLAVQKWLQVRNVVTPVALTSLAVAVVNAALNAILIRVARLGLVGSALATSLSRAVNLVLLVEYVRRTPTEWDAVVDPEGDGRARGVSKPRAFLAAVAAAAADARARPDAVARMTRLGARGAVMVAAEASSFDVTVVFASQLGQVALDAHMALLNICSLTFMTGPMAFGIAANVRVGNLLGAGAPDRARVAAVVSIAFGVAWMAACALLIVAFRRRVGEIFVGSDDSDVTRLVAVIAPVAAVFQIFDGALGACNGVLRACGRQAALARVNIAALWGVGVVVGFALTFPANMGVVGLWVGLAVGVACGGTGLVWMSARLDWDREASLARTGSAPDVRLIDPSAATTETEEDSEAEDDERARLVRGRIDEETGGGNVDEVRRAAANAPAKPDEDE